MPSAAPHSPEVEECLLGAALLSDASADVLVGTVTAADFYVPAHQRIAEAICDLRHLGASTDALTVGNWLERHDALQSVGGGLLTHLQAITPSTGHTATYAQIVADDAVRRRIQVAAIGIVRQSGDRSLPVPSLLAAAEALARDSAPALVDKGPDPTAEEFVASRDESYDWLVPGLIERGDRFMWTGGEGTAGKSTLLRQIAVQLGAGIHPWSHVRIRPLRVLIVDMENSGGQVARKLGPLLDLARSERQLSFASTDDGFDAGALRVRVHPQGLDLLRLEDRRWLTGRIASQPEPVDLLVTGPTYKMVGGKPTDEEPAAFVAKFFDELRAEYGVGMMFEAHSPHATGEDGQRTLRPYGASLWMRWPEFGFGIRPSKRDESQGLWELKPWRGARDEGRDWPFFIRRGGRWPWEVAYPQSTSSVTQEDF